MRRAALVTALLAAAFGLLPHHSGVRPVAEPLLCFQTSAPPPGPEEICYLPPWG